MSETRDLFSTVSTSSPTAVSRELTDTEVVVSTRTALFSPNKF